MFLLFFFFKQKTAYEMRISDWSSDVCSSDLFLRHYIVFNADQIDGLPAYFYPSDEPEQPLIPSERQAAIDAFFTGIPADVRHGGNQAYFTPTFDHIPLPNRTAFRSMDHYAYRSEELLVGKACVSTCRSRLSP